MNKFMESIKLWTFTILQNQVPVKLKITFLVIINEL